jgi:hypothetical protein
MGSRSRAAPKPKEVLTPEQLAKKRAEELRRRQRIRTETEATHDGRFKVTQTPGSQLQGTDRLLDALIDKHPEKDPAKIK